MSLDSISWTDSFSGWELIATGLVSFLSTGFGVFLAISMERRVAERRERLRAVDDAIVLLDEMMRRSMEGAPLGSTMMSTIWPASMRGLEIIGRLNVVDEWLPAWFRGEVWVLLRDTANRALGHSLEMSDFQREGRTEAVEAELRRAIGKRRQRRGRGWYRENTRPAPPRRVNPTRRS